MEEVDLDLCGDNISLSTDSYGETGVGVNGRVKNKPGETKIGRTILIGNVNSARLCAYMHRHKLHRKPPGWMVMDNIEVNNILEDIKPMIKGEGGYRKNL